MNQNSDTDITRLKDNLDLIRLGSKSIYIVGTAHVSAASVILAEETIREIKPDTVAIELCDARYQSLKNPERWKNTDIVQVIRSGKAYVLMAQLMLASFQKKLGTHLQVKPGAEMMRAAQVADEVGSRLVLADRDVTTTLKRVWSRLGLWSMCKVIGSMLAGLFSSKQFEADEIERIKNSDALDELMREFSEVLPEVQAALIDERDKYLAASLMDAPGKIVLAVVGAGHVPGIKRYLGSVINKEELDRIPPPRLLLRAIGWLIPAAAAALLIYGFFVSGAQASLDLLSAWIWVTGGFAALGAALALGHPLTILSAFIAAPITTIHPLLASGWVAGLVEAVLKRPRVSDLETIADDMGTLRGWFRNRVSKILLIMALTNLLGTLGALVGIRVVASMISASQGVMH